MNRMCMRRIGGAVVADARHAPLGQVAGMTQSEGPMDWVAGVKLCLVRSVFRPHCQAQLNSGLIAPVS